MFEDTPPISEVDVLTSPDPVAAELATTQPRADDMAALLMLDPDVLSDAGRIDLLVAFNGTSPCYRPPSSRSSPP
jgi:hypothetical protein